MSVSFTDEDEEAMLEKGYETDQSELGNVYYPKVNSICPAFFREIPLLIIREVSLWTNILRHQLRRKSPGH